MAGENEARKHDGGNDVIAVAEAATGLALLVVPGRRAVVVGKELSGIAAAVARVAGIALIGLGIACWPGLPIIGMLIYTAVVAIYLAYLGLAVVDQRTSVASGSHPYDHGNTLEARSG